MVKNSLIVVGLGYGDEGKGITTDFLCKKYPNSIVIRYNGGHQAGHTVYKTLDDYHVFSSFGSGTLQGVPTYWSSYCTFSPIHFLDELISLNENPKIFIDNHCPVTTHYDVLYNRALESSLGLNRNGSCGVGFGATIERERSKKISLKFSDLLNSEKLIKKRLDQIRKYYRFKVNIETNYNFDSFDNDNEDKIFLNSIKQIKSLLGKIIHPVNEDHIFQNNKWDTFIFEGAQGILLDQKYGKTPNITKSNTTSQNALEILKRQNIFSNIEIYYVTRAYHTRHGAGPFREQGSLKLSNKKTETNQYNPFQQNFKISYLDIDLVNYALECDNVHSSNINKNLVITCVDQIKGGFIRYFLANELNKTYYNELPLLLNCSFKRIFFSSSVFSANFTS